MATARPRRSKCRVGVQMSVDRVRDEIAFDDPPPESWMVVEQYRRSRELVGRHQAGMHNDVGGAHPIDDVSQVRRERVARVIDLLAREEE